MDAMRLVEISAFGGPRVLRETRGPLPVPQAGEVLVRVAYAGVNRPDVAQRQGVYPPPPGASPVPGLEIAGQVVATGPGCARWRVGDAVCALVAGGGYAEYATAPEAQCLPLPRGLSVCEAAALPETAFTVWSNVFERGALARGELLLVHGGTSGIGTLAIQLAKARGARVIATAGSEDKCAACRELGADLAVNYRETDFVTAVKEFSAGRGADVILDMVGGDYTQRNLSALAVEGRLVFIAFLRGAKVELNLAPVMMKRLTVTGSTLRARPVEHKAPIARSLQHIVWPLLASGVVRPVIDRVFPLSEAAAAHALMESNRHIGKLLLQVG